MRQSNWNPVLFSYANRYSKYKTIGLRNNLLNCCQYSNKTYTDTCTESTTGVDVVISIEQSTHRFIHDCYVNALRKTFSMFFPSRSGPLFHCFSVKSSQESVFGYPYPTCPRAPKVHRFENIPSAYAVSSSLKRLLTLSCCN